MGFKPPTNAQAIEVIVRHQPGLSQAEIAKALFGKDGYQQQVNQDVNWLERQGYIISEGENPKRYKANRPGPSASALSPRLPDNGGSRAALNSST
jgi:hypothetical protein